MLCVNWFAETTALITDFLCVVDKNYPIHDMCVDLRFYNIFVSVLKYIRSEKCI